MLSLPYPKIETLFERGDDFKVRADRLRSPAFGAVDRWIVTEKVDGTNIRLHFWRESDDFLGYEIGGRTDKAEIQKNLIGPLYQIVDKIEPGVVGILLDYDLISLTIYGEGYGAGIQKNGGRYRPDPSFIVFDMLVNSHMWLPFTEVQKNSALLGLEVVPYLGTLTKADTVSRIVNGSQSLLGNFVAEGVVAQPIVPLYDNRGSRVVWKLKGKDF